MCSEIPKLLTIPEVAHHLRITESRAYELARLDILPVCRLQRQIRVDASRLSDWIAAGGQALPGGWKHEV